MVHHRLDPNCRQPPNAMARDKIDIRSTGTRRWLAVDVDVTAITGTVAIVAQALVFNVHTNVCTGVLLSNSSSASFAHCGDNGHQRMHTARRTMTPAALHVTLDRPPFDHAARDSLQPVAFLFFLSSLGHGMLSSRLSSLSSSYAREQSVLHHGR